MSNREISCVKEDNNHDNCSMLHQVRKARTEANTEDLWEKKETKNLYFFSQLGFFFGQFLSRAWERRSFACMITNIPKQWERNLTSLYTCCWLSGIQATLISQGKNLSSFSQQHVTFRRYPLAKNKEAAVLVSQIRDYSIFSSPCLTVSLHPGQSYLRHG